MPDTALCVDILLPLALDRQYTYALPPSMREHAAVGVPVMVPLGKTKRYMGIILRIHSDPPRGIALREVMGIVDPHPIVTPLQLQLWQWIADYYMATLGEVFKAAVPAALRLDSDTFLYPVSQPVDLLIELPELDACLYQLVLQRGGIALQQALRQMNRRGTMAAIHRLHAQGFIHFDERIRPARPRLREPFLQLAEAYCAIPWEQWIADPRWRLQRAPLQLAALEA